MSYSYETRGDMTVFKFFCDRGDFDEVIGELRNSLTPAEISEKWTFWKDAMIHRVMNFFIFEEDEFVKFIVNDKVYNTQVSFELKPNDHMAFFCRCQIYKYITNLVYEPPVSPIDLESTDLYCYETM